ncbi:hypothetical protein [Roseiarcus sp.]|uniref:hypothetical protein n=1 Tax=Roseiarcus sp. TaxID=1969460 RepID=UPI003F9944F9
MTFETLKFAIGAIAALAVLCIAVVYLGRFLSWIERSEIARQKAEAAAEVERNRAAAPAVVAPELDGVPTQHIVAIAAAVAAYGFRVIHIADHSTGRAWASEGRWMHQTSHRTH